MTSTTFVSCLYDLDRREGAARHRSVDDYLELSRALFALQIPLVVHTDDHLVEQLTDICRAEGAATSTRIVARPLESWPAHDHLAAVDDAFRAGRRNGTVTSTTKDTAAYVIVSWSKREQLVAVAADDPFGGDALAWVDLGVAHVAPVDPEQLRRVAHHRSSRVRLSVLHGGLDPGCRRDRQSFYAARERPLVASGLIWCPLPMVDTLDGWFTSELACCLASGFPSFDETILGAVILDHPEAFDVFAGDHHGLFSEFDRAVEASVALDTRRILEQAHHDPSPDTRRTLARHVLHRPALLPATESAARGLEIESSPTLLGDLITGTRIGTIGVPVAPTARNCNPTIAANEPEGGFIGIVRQVNYEFDADGRYRFLEREHEVRTRNVAVGMGAGGGPDLDIDWSIEIDDTGSGLFRGHGLVRGFEDLRLFRSQGRWCALAGIAEALPDALPRIALVTFDDEWRVADAVVLRGPDPDRVEKNWMPVAAADGAAPLLVYSCFPVLVFGADAATGDLHLAAEDPTPVLARMFRGGSQLVPFDGGWLAVIHETLSWGEGSRFYLHRFVTFGTDFALTAASHPFRFVGSDVEFACGLALDDDDAVVTFGVHDAQAALALVPLEGVRSSLVPVTAPAAT